MQMTQFKLLILSILLSLNVLGAGSYIQGPALIEGFTTTASSAGTLTLTVSSETKQIITGATTHTVVAPDATTLPLGRKFLIINKSSGNVTVNDGSGGGLLVTIAGGTQAEIHLRAAGSAAGTWDVLESSAGGGGGGGTWGSITGFLSDQTDLQSALDAKADENNPGFAGTIGTTITASRLLVTDASSNLAASATTSTEAGYLSGVTSAIQTQINAITPISASYEISNLGLATSVGSSALTIALKQADGATNPSTGASAVKVGMRSSTLTSGLYNQRSATAATSLVISSGSTLGQTSNRAARLYIYLIDNAGTLELAVSQTLFPESQLVSTTAEGGAGAADSGTVMYSTTARSSVPFRLVGFLDNTQTTAGTWASAGTKLQAGQYGALTSEKPGCLYTGTPTGTLANALNLMTFPTVVNDAYSMYSSGLATIKISGFYNIAAASSQAAAYIAGSSAVTIIAIDGTEAYTSVENASGAAGVLYPKISVNNIFLLAGQQVSILSLNNGTTPTFTNSLTGSNWFSLIKVQ